MCVYTCTCVCVACIHIYRYRYTDIHTYLPRHQCGGQRITGRIWFSVSPYGSRGWNSGLVDLVARAFVCWVISWTKSSKSLLQLFPSIAETHRGVQYHHSVCCVCICSVVCLYLSMYLPDFLWKESFYPQNLYFPLKSEIFQQNVVFKGGDGSSGKIQAGQMTRWLSFQVQLTDTWPLKGHPQKTKLKYKS